MSNEEVVEKKDETKEEIFARLKKNRMHQLDEAIRKLSNLLSYAYKPTRKQAVAMSEEVWAKWNDFDQECRTSKKVVDTGKTEED